VVIGLKAPLAEPYGEAGKVTGIETADPEQAQVHHRLADVALNHYGGGQHYRAKDEEHYDLRA
jgi:hypothetical protein